MTKTATSTEPGSSAFPSTGTPSTSDSGPFKRPPIVSPRGGGIKKRLGNPGSSVGLNAGPRHPLQPQPQQQRGRGVLFGRGRAAFQQNQNRFRYANAVINGNRNGLRRQNQGQIGQRQHSQHSQQHQQGETIFVPPSRIRYTQSSVKSTFNDGRSLVSTYQQLATRQIKKREIPMIDVIQMDGQYWTLNNRRLAVFSELERRGKCKVIRVRVRPPTDAITEWLQRNSTTNSGRSIKIRVLAEEAEKCPTERLELFEDLLGGPAPANNRKPDNWSREKYEREKVERLERERAARNPKIGLPDGWGERRLPAVAERAAASSGDGVCAEAGDGVMFDPRDFDFDLDDLLLDPEEAATTPVSSGDSGRGSTSNISEIFSQNGGGRGGSNQAADDAFDVDDIDFDREDLYLDGVPSLETIEDGTASPTPSEALTTDLGRSLHLHSPVGRRFVVDDRHSDPHRRHVVADSSSSSSLTADPLNLLPVTRVLNAGKRKRQLAYYYLKKYGQPRAPMMPKPDNSDSYFCGCGHREITLTELGRHKDRSGHWAFKGVGFDSLRHLIDTEDLRINPPTD